MQSSLILVNCIYIYLVHCVVDNYYILYYIITLQQSHYSIEI